MTGEKKYMEKSGKCSRTGVTKHEHFKSGLCLDTCWHLGCAARLWSEEGMVFFVPRWKQPVHISFYIFLSVYPWEAHANAAVPVSHPNATALRCKLALAVRLMWIFDQKKRYFLWSFVYNASWTLVRQGPGWHSPSNSHRLDSQGCSFVSPTFSRLQVQHSRMPLPWRLYSQGANWGHGSE